MTTLYFSGVGRLHAQYETNGFQSDKFEIEDMPEGARFVQDILHPYGFLTALRKATKLKKRGMGHVAIVCSNLIFMCRSKTGRSASNNFWGNPLFRKVVDSNCMIQRSIWLIAFMVCAGVRWLVEQPQSSVLRRIPMFEWIPARYDGGERRLVHGFMGAFGSKTRKPTYWLGDADLISTLDKPLDVSRFQDPTGTVTRLPDGRVTGNVKAIKATQTYTED